MESRNNVGEVPFWYGRFKSQGACCQISDKASFYGNGRIEIGDNVRIDDFCILSAGEGGIKIGSNVHIACHTSIIGAGRIEIEDYAMIGGHSAIYSSTDDFSGNYLIGPNIDKRLTNVISKPVVFKKHSVIGSHCVVMPGVTINEGAAVGAMSLVKKDLDEFTIYGGNPLRLIRARKTGLKQLIESGQLPDSVYLEGIDWYV